MKTVEIQSKLTVTREMLEAVRVAHCSHDDNDKPNHKCVGTMCVTPGGVELFCRLCGDETNCWLWSQMYNPAQREKERSK